MDSTRDRMTREAEYLENVAIPRAAAAAADGDRAAADLNQGSHYDRACAARAAAVARADAAEYAEFAAALRDGEIPDGLDLT